MHVVTQSMKECPIFVIINSDMLFISTREEIQSVLFEDLLYTPKEEEYTFER